ncbi:MAG: hypothetical protein MRERV_25c016 [Mycoplasmataceae bacterium RV_VA103A]|nr:MAG: hypothetical protein MRERV_25c016 [Mycoplasmataceae bacterium RV_VA103A]
MGGGGNQKWTVIGTTLKTARAKIIKDYDHFFSAKTTQSK